MAELQRSVTSFRRQGSSGLVWKDKFLSASQNRNNHPNNHQQQPPDPAPRRSRSAGAQPHGPVNVTFTPKLDGAPPYRAINIAPPPPKEDPPSPKVPTCGLCGFFGKQPVAGHRTTSKSKKLR